MKRAFIFAFIVLLPFTIIPQAFAQEKQGVEVIPAMIEITLTKDDQQETFDITYTNHEDSSVLLDLTSVNFIQQDVTGIVQFTDLDSTQYVYGLASYISFPENELLLEPQETRTITVTVTNRLDLSPGGHYAGVLAKTVPNEGQVRSRIEPAVASLIYLAKEGGEQYALSIRDVTPSETSIRGSHPSIVGITFQNEGNIHVKPYGRIEIKDMFGRLVYKGVINESSLFVLPSSRRMIENRVKPVNTDFGFGLYTLTISGQDSLKKVSYSYQNSYLFVSPTFLIILIMGISIVIYAKRRKAKNKKA